MRKKTILALVRVMHAGGGVTLNVSSLLKHIVRCTDWEVVLITAPKNGAPPLQLDSAKGFAIRVLKTRQPPLLGRIIDCWPVGFKKALLEELPEVDLVHYHSLWRYPTRVGCPLIRRFGKPYMVAPRGTLNPLAFQYKSLRKRVALRTYERKNLSDAACLHATSLAEASNIRKMGFANPIAVIPAGVHEEALAAFDASLNKAVTTPRPINRKRRLLCVSRLHPIKRIKELAQAWVAIAGQYPDWELVLVGTGKPRYEAEIIKVLRENPASEKTVVFQGYLSGRNLWNAYLEADLYVMPSHSENFGSVVVEALAAQLPVIATKGTPWEGLTKQRCGWWVEKNQRELICALKEAMSLSAEQRQYMGHLGRKWVLEKFSWPVIARKTVEVYDWIIRGCERTEAPACVVTDEQTIFRNAKAM